ncbi:uncharacterized protein MELLADRAFT_84669 [Melampsora larici-populina 98AG31]|uniref:Uncharacterized protein n=1 Tax=Melampsora larici-populina (strain 98AG31 / pathotype 3-4-7) TaxID=747676 RepID=F4RGE6_MELLP|nr:uncharacterized protein MELLADRAFT_84669 [Melampsora larici-populina 98AG31]EGG08495.1 hypothetical protein MELLADRAFT_84669 [Melampsora larici-populina 98AG31]
MSTRKGGTNVAYECPHLPTCYDPSSKGKPCQDCNGLNLTGVRNHTLTTRQHAFCAPGCPVYKLTDLSQIEFKRKKCSTTTDLPGSSNVTQTRTFKKCSTATNLPGSSNVTPIHTSKKCSTPTDLPGSRNVTRSRTSSTERSPSPSVRAGNTLRMRQRERTYEGAVSTNQGGSGEPSLRRSGVWSTSACNPVQDKFSGMSINPEKFTLQEPHHSSPKASSFTRETNRNSSNVPGNSRSKNLIGDMSTAFAGPHHTQLESSSAPNPGVANQLHALINSRISKEVEPLMSDSLILDPAAQAKNICYEKPFRWDWKFGALLVVSSIHIFWFIRAWWDEYTHAD